jgi:transcriptional regulator with XRE-family HTH domain
MANSIIVDGEKVVELRTRKGLSQKELAARAGLNTRTLSTVEAGGRVSLLTLNKISTQLGVHPTQVSKSTEATHDVDDTASSEPIKPSSYERTEYKEVTSAKEVIDICEMAWRLGLYDFDFDPESDETVQAMKVVTNTVRNTIYNSNGYEVEGFDRFDAVLSLRLRLDHLKAQNINVLLGKSTFWETYDEQVRSSDEEFNSIQRQRSRTVVNLYFTKDPKKRHYNYVWTDYKAALHSEDDDFPF